MAVGDRPRPRPDERDPGVVHDRLHVNATARHDLERFVEGQRPVYDGGAARGSTANQILGEIDAISESGRQERAVQ